jgi:tripartite-type tricarboxylate transporter receptor subunit TctC
MRSANHRLQAIAITLASACAVASASAPASAESWPQRTVRVILPNPPGVGLDLVTRLFTERLGLRWGKPVIVENLPGADGNIAVREFVGKRDNHTLLYSFAGPITINPLIYRKLPYDPALDLVPIASTTDNFLVIAASAALKVNSLAELETVARSRSSKLNWAATPGLPYFAFSGYQKTAGIDMVHVPYRDFGQAFADLTEGRIDLMVSGVAPLQPYASAGKVRLLAFFNDQRARVAPDVMTIAEAGYGNLTFNAITGFFGWRGMPGELRERIAADVRAVAADPLIRDRLANMGSVVRPGTPEEFAAVIEDQRKKVAAIAAAVGIKPTQ